MSEDHDPESKTEEPTEKRLADAHDKGDMPVSREIALLASLSGLLIVLSLMLERRSVELASVLIHFLDDPAGWRLGRGEDAERIIGILAVAGGNFLLPVLGLLAFLGVVASAAQNPFRFVPTRIAPDLGRISPQAGFRRLFGPRGWTEFGKNLFKISAVALLTGVMLAGQKLVLVNSVMVDPQLLPHNLLTLAAKVVGSVTAATLLIATADLVWARILWRRDHRMTRQEVKEELRQMEGDRLMKARLRSLRLDRSRKRMLAAVPQATMVVVNPTHYAVALRYVRSEGGAPVVVAKGVDLIALKIRAIAEEARIPIIEDKPLARSLHAAVEVDGAIPPEFYRAVAEIVHLIQQKKHWRKASYGITA